jgi:hypothetical protein
LSGLKTSGYNPGTGQLTVTGSMTSTVCQALLRSIIYVDLKTIPNTSDRKITVKVTAGLASSNLPAVTIGVAAPPATQSTYAQAPQAPPKGVPPPYQPRQVWPWKPNQYGVPPPGTPFLMPPPLVWGPSFASDPDYPKAVYRLTGTDALSLSAQTPSITAEASTPLARALAKTCNISPDRGWMITYKDLSPWYIRVNQYQAWAGVNPVVQTLTWGNLGGESYKDPKRGWPYGGTSIDARIFMGISSGPLPGSITNGMQVHWIQVVTANLAPKTGQPFITDQPYGGAQPTYTFIDNGNRPDGLPWYDNVDANGNPIRGADGTFVFANAKEFFDAPRYPIASNFLPIWNAELYVAWANPDAKILVIGKFGRGYGFYGSIVP